MTLRTELYEQENAKLERDIANGTCNWVEHAITEVERILTMPVEFSGWDGIGYSTVDFSYALTKVEVKSFFSFRFRNQCEEMVRTLRSYERNTPLVKYYASFGGAAHLPKELLYQRDRGVTVVAKIALRGYRSGEPGPTVEGIQSVPAIMDFIREIAQEMCDQGNGILLKQEQMRAIRNLPCSPEDLN
jgi:hypothetical protein